MSAPVTAPQVYRAIHAISTALSKAGIAKTHTNLQDQYQYRSIDDVLGRLAPLLVKHRLCVLPRVLAREMAERPGEAGSTLVNVHLLVAYDLVSSRDGSRHTIEASGEALDPADKATAKAMSAAYKSAMLQAFCVPIGNTEEADATTNRLRKRVIEREPVQGWSAWTEDIIEILGACETEDALDRMRSRQAALLTAISRERPDLYSRIGQAFAAQSATLARPQSGHLTPSVELSAGETGAPRTKEAIDA